LFRLHFLDERAIRFGTTVEKALGTRSRLLTHIARLLNQNSPNEALIPFNAKLSKRKEPQPRMNPTDTDVEVPVESIGIEAGT